MAVRGVQHSWGGCQWGAGWMSVGCWVAVSGVLGWLSVVYSTVGVLGGAAAPQVCAHKGDPTLTWLGQSPCRVAHRLLLPSMFWGGGIKHLCSQLAGL